MEEYEIDDDFDLEDNEEDYLEDDDIIIPEDMDDEDIDEDFIYEQLNSRKNTRGKQKFINNSFTNDIVAKESGGNYRAVNPHSSAAGKYQFLWNTWGNKIAKYTGITSKEDFLNSPEAQDDFYNNYYLPNELMPAVSRIKSKLNPKLSINQLAKLVHFRGEKGAIDYLEGRVSDKPESYNSSISSYIGNMQLGGLNMLQPKAIQPLAVNFKMPEINQVENISNQTDVSGGLNIGGIAGTLSDIYNTGKQAISKVASNLSEGLDIAEQFTSQQVANAQHRRMLQQLYGDNPANYAPVTQRINNNPVLQ